MLANQNKNTYDRKTDEYIVAYIDLLGVTNKIKSKDSQLAMNKLHNLYTFSVKLTRDVQIEENQDIQVNYPLSKANGLPASTTSKPDMSGLTTISTGVNLG